MKEGRERIKKVAKGREQGKHIALNRRSRSCQGGNR